MSLVTPTESDGSSAQSTTVSYGSSPKDVTVRLAEDQAAVLRGDADTRSSEYWIRCLPHDFPAITVTENTNAGLPGEGFYLLGTAVVAFGDGSFAMVLDVHGTPVWYRRADKPVVNLDLVAPNVLSYTVNAVPAGFGTDPSATYELHDLATSRTTYVQAVGAPTDVHEFRTLANGDHLVQSSALVSGIDLTGLQQFGAGSTVADCVLQEIDNSGALVWTWRASDHIDIVRESTYPQRSYVKGQTVVDAFHCNSEDEAQNGDLLVSARNLDAVFLISKATGTIVWKLGGAAYSRDGAQLLRLPGDPGFFRQHDARFVSDDAITLFDNESGTMAPARAVAFSVDLAGGTATPTRQRTGPATSVAMGSARLQADGHVVVGWGEPANGHTALTEFDGAGHDLLEVAFPSGSMSFRAIKVPVGALDLGILRRAVGTPWRRLGFAQQRACRAAAGMIPPPSRMIHWNLSGAIVHRGVLLPFIDALELPNVSLHVHDGFAGLPWSGGRESGAMIDPAVLDDVIEQYRRRDVGFNLLFSSHLLGPDDLGNEYGNLLLEKLHEERNGVVVSDTVLADYVRDRYPKYRLIRSVVNAYLDEVIYRRPMEIVRYFEEKTRHYDRVVVPSELNLRFDILDDLDKSKLEFLVNSNCFWHCPLSLKHYRAIARGFKTAGGSSGARCCLARVARGPEQDRVLAHLQKHQGLYDESGKLIKRLKRGQPVIVRKSWMKYEQMALMQRKGCVHFKLQGRDMAADLFKDALHTFVIPYDD